MSEDPFKWNGTFLGKIEDDNIVQIFKYNNFEYWNIQINGYYTSCLIRKTTTYTPCIVDELKPIFGLIKLGTHYGYYKNGYVIFIRAQTDITGKYIYGDTTLGDIANEIKTDTELITKIKHIYVFRDLLCLSKSTDNSIGIRRSRQGYLYPVSLIDTNIKIEKLCNLEKSTYLPESVFNRWFVNTSPSTILKHMCKLYNRDKVSSLIFKFKSRIDTVVRNVGNQDYMDLTDVITRRLANRFQYQS